jgi:NIPSNAP
VGAVGGMGMMAGAGSDRKSRYYLLENYFLRQSTQLERLNEFMSQGFLPAAGKIHAGPKIFLEAQVAAHVPQFVCVLGLESLEELATIRARLRQDAAYQKAFAAWESGPEPPYEHFSHTLLKATDYSPEIEPAKGKRRIFELRVYHSPTWKQLAALHQRFAGPEIKIFHRCGIHPILYTETVIGANMPNLTYLIPFESLAAREKAWEAFQADTEWTKVRKESIDAHGQISSVIQVSLLRSSAYSPVT